MNKGGRLAIVSVAVLAGGLGGWALIRLASAPSAKPIAGPASAPRNVTDFALDDPPPLAAKTHERPATSGYREDTEAGEAGAFRNQRTIHFADRAAMERFLAAAQGKGIAVLGSLDRLNVLRVGFLSLDELSGLLDGSEQLGMIFPVTLPQPAGGGVQAGALGFGPNLLKWLGVEGDQSAWGSGVKIAVLDTGVATNSALSSITNQYLVAPPTDLSTWNGHGTAVSSLIEQIAPGAELLSWRIADDNGTSDSFKLAEGILAAVDAGVNLINISMGSYGNSSVLQSAIEVAQAAGIVIYASAGNDGYTSVSYPAAYPGVVSVGAIEGAGERLEFSNTGNVTMVAPGLELLTDWPDSQKVYFSGTSASAPIALAINAVLASNGGSTTLTSQQALELQLAYLNESGAPGKDVEYGDGAVNLRALERNQPGLVDAAIASNYVTTDANGNSVLYVTVQNRGTETMVNATVNVTTPSGNSSINITTLPANQTATYTIPFNAAGQSATLQSSVQVSGGTDLDPSNNRRSSAYTPSTP